VNCTPFVRKTYETFKRLILGLSTLVLKLTLLENRREHGDRFNDAVLIMGTLV